MSIMAELEDPESPKELYDLINDSDSDLWLQGHETDMLLMSGELTIECDGLGGDLEELLQWTDLRVSRLPSNSEYSERFVIKG